MLINDRIGIIGAGFVGGAIANTLSNPMILDIDPSRGSATYDQIRECRAVFVCVPSPPTEDGHCDSSNLESVLENLNGYQGVIISKVTAPPDVYRRLGQKYHNLVYSPEFLTAANAIEDYKRTPYVIIGGTVEAYMNEALRLIERTLGHLDTVRMCSLEEAAMIKYATNAFLATKVVFMNEIKNLCDESGIDYAAIAYTLAIDKRIGSSHLQVPGPDGQYGFGGACFPKDTAALLQYATDVGVNLDVLKMATKINSMLRLKDK